MCLGSMLHVYAAVRRPPLNSVSLSQPRLAARAKRARDNPEIKAMPVTAGPCGGVEAERDQARWRCVAISAPRPSSTAAPGLGTGAEAGNVGLSNPEAKTEPTPPTVNFITWFAPKFAA